jgi:hypothetical protein
LNQKSTTWRMARVCSGVLPQREPMMLRRQDFRHAANGHVDGQLFVNGFLFSSAA